MAGLFLAAVVFFATVFFAGAFFATAFFAGADFFATVFFAGAFFATAFFAGAAFFAVAKVLPLAGEFVLRVVLPRPAAPDFGATFPPRAVVVRAAEAFRFLVAGAGARFAEDDFFDG